MNAALSILMIAALSATPAKLTTLDGETFDGDMISLNTQTIEFETAGDVRSFPVESLMRLDFQVDSATSPSAPPQAATLVDQTQLVMTALSLTDKTISLSSNLFGTQEVALGSVKNIRWGNLDEKVTEAWADLKARDVRDDLLVFRKEDVLDYVAGSVVNISEKGVTVNVRGRDLTAPLERVFGVLFANRTAQDTPGLGIVRTSSGDRLKVTELNLKENELTLTTLTNLKLKLPLTKIQDIDFGGGRIQYLADLPFDESESTSPDEDFPVVWFTARNFPAGTGGRRQLAVDGKTYPRGLWLHSGAHIRFRLNREFTEFRAIAGFDQTHIGRMPRFDPKVKLIIEADSEQLYVKEFSWKTPAEKLNLDLSNVRELVIRVESLGDAKGILEHFALADAQLIK